MLTGHNIYLKTGKLQVNTIGEKKNITGANQKPVDKYCLKSYSHNVNKGNHFWGIFFKFILTFVQFFFNSVSCDQFLNFLLVWISFYLIEKHVLFAWLLLVLVLVLIAYVLTTAVYNEVNHIRDLRKMGIILGGYTRYNEDPKNGRKCYKTYVLKCQNVSHT